mmetsp:Transcript_33372/g.37906  ORF Transcript_33372/g.37906 Transcript_33372/m.37906 type:complete len:419 (+) Transcript_33372:50-1306(+)
MNMDSASKSSQSMSAESRNGSSASKKIKKELPLKIKAWCGHCFMTFENGPGSKIVHNHLTKKCDGYNCFKPQEGDKVCVRKFPNTNSANRHTYCYSREVVEGWDRTLRVLRNEASSTDLENFLEGLTLGQMNTDDDGELTGEASDIDAKLRTATESIRNHRTAENINRDQTIENFLADVKSAEERSAMLVFGEDKSKAGSDIFGSEYDFMYKLSPGYERVPSAAGDDIRSLSGVSQHSQAISTTSGIGLSCANSTGLQGILSSAVSEGINRNHDIEHDLKSLNDAASHHGVMSPDMDQVLAEKLWSEQQKMSAGGTEVAPSESQISSSTQCGYKVHNKTTITEIFDLLQQEMGTEISTDALENLKKVMRESGLTNAQLLRLKKRKYGSWDFFTKEYGSVCSEIEGTALMLEFLLEETV